MPTKDEPLVEAKLCAERRFVRALCVHLIVRSYAGFVRSGRASLRQSARGFPPSSVRLPSREPARLPAHWLARPRDRPLANRSPNPNP